MKAQNISEIIEKYIMEGKLSGGALLVRKKDEIVYQNTWGFSNIRNQTPIGIDSIYAYMSMTKCITAVAVMQLVENGKLRLDDKISKYIPEFRNMQISVDKRYDGSANPIFKIPLILTFNSKRLKTVPADREITILDLLSHSSGLQEGIVGILQYYKQKPSNDTLEQRVKKYGDYVLDFQPGTSALYSPLAGFDILGYLVEKVSGMKYSEYVKKNILEPLDMKDATFNLSEEQKKRLVTAYSRKGKRLVDVTGSKLGFNSVLKIKDTIYEAGCGGLFGTLSDYDHFANMLCNEGIYNGRRILKQETVRLMQTPAQNPCIRIEAMPGRAWGLSMNIRLTSGENGRITRKGTYGWSGHYGTYYFIYPDEKLYAIFLTNGVDGGADSALQPKLEEIVLEVFGSRQDE